MLANPAVWVSVDTTGAVAKGRVEGLRGTASFLINQFLTIASNTLSLSLSAVSFAVRCGIDAGVRVLQATPLFVWLAIHRTSTPLHGLL